MADVKYDFFEYKKVFRDQEKRLKIINTLSFIPTPLYLRIVYLIKTGRKLNLKNPTGFSEKIQWLKLHRQRTDYSQLVDKYEVKKYISDHYGEQYVIPCYGVWNSFDEIDFRRLPNTFVLKCTHDSGSVKVIHDKNQINIEELRNFFNGRLLIDQYNLSREYPYKNVKPRIIAEKYFETIDKGSIYDYKFFCFNGEPKVGYVLSGRSIDEKETWFDMSFNRLDIVDVTTPDADPYLEKPNCFEKMVDFAKRLSAGKDFVRVDLYEDRGHIYFGEFTFFPYGGFVILQPEQWETRLGEWIKTN